MNQAKMNRTETNRAKLLALDAGTAYHHFSLNDPAIRQHIDALIYLDDFQPQQLNHCQALLVPCRTPSQQLARYRDQLQAFMTAGGWIIAMGETDHASWLNDIDFEPRPTNFWWWLEPGADLGLRFPQPNHQLFRFIDPGDAAWHIHGVFQPPADAHSLIDYRDEGSLLYERPVGAGRLIATSLDPFYHHGSFFMPATSRFLHGFMPWLRQQLDQTETS